MTGITVMGGLGNMMFQLATGETWRKRGIDIKYTNVDTNFIFITETCISKISPLRYKDIFVHFDWYQYRVSESVRKTLVKKTFPFHYVDVDAQDGIEYIAYFQSEKNFPDREFIRYLFEPSDEIKIELAKFDNLLVGNTCSVHVRRGDYVRQQDIHPLPGITYYNDAMKTLDASHIDRFLVFSDDLEWCKQNFIGDKFVFMDNMDFVDMYLISKCKHHIVANSSFSWWGAWLGEAPDSIVIAPKTWLIIANKDTSDIIPERWVKI